MPVGVYGEVLGDKLNLTGVIASLDGEKLYKKSVTADVKNAEITGESLAEELLNMGGREILEELGLLK